MELSDNQRTVFERRYIRKDKDGNHLETIDDVFHRVARTIASVELEEDREYIEESFYDILSNLEFLPNSPTFTGAGTPLGMLSACYLLPLEDDMGKTRGGIFDTLKDMALISQTGGGVGFSLSNLRPDGAYISTSGGKATGPVGFLKVFDKASEVISQGGTRRGAGMAVLRYDHPDIIDFINCKDDESDITNFNLSVAVDEVFMNGVRNNDLIQLINPQDNTVCDTIPARRIMRAISNHVVKNGEPGLLFLDNANKDNPCPHLGQYEATNPCGEQWLLPYESCCLGTINLVAHIKDREIDYQHLDRTIAMGVRFLDNVIDVNKYIPTIPELEEKAKATRRIGLGITGLADILIIKGLRYGSDEAAEFVETLMEYIRYKAMESSLDLSIERGPFPEFYNSIYNSGEWQPPRDVEEWAILKGDIEMNGIRNATTLTIAPTGTRSTIAGVEGYGCEPIFALAYTRTVIEREEEIELTYASPLFQKALDETKTKDQERILKEVAKTGTLAQDITGVPDTIKKVFVTARDIDPLDHVKMQAAAQKNVDAAISKTVNSPEGTTVEQVEDILFEAWRKGCKGITIYVANSREKTILQTKDDKDDNNDIFVRNRPEQLTGVTIRQPTPLGTAFITLNRNGENEPFEVFINIGRAGSDVSAVAEGLGRLISLILRMPSDMEEKVRLEHVVEQLKGIGGGNPLGFGKNRIRSLPDGVAEVLGKQLGIIENASYELLDMCPECGNATLVTAEGCSHCKTCGYKKC